MLNEIKRVVEQYEPKPLGNPRKYAVLLPLVTIDGEIHVLYEVRSRRISQPGETSFPGGAVEPGETFQEAAVRETMEELNIPADQIEVYGELDFVVSPTHVIHCFVGELKNIRPESLNLNPEVESVFTLPLSYLLANDPEYHVTRMRTEYDNDFPFDLISNGKKFKWNTFRQSIPFYRLPNNYLWGFTANFTHRFTQLIQESK